MDTKDLNGKYNGYGSCPLFVGGNKLMLAEFTYGGVPSVSYTHLTLPTSDLV